MILTCIVIAIIVCVPIQLCDAECGCSSKGIKVTDFKVDDMILTAENLLKINGFKATQGVRWKNNEVLYSFDPSYPDKNKGPIREYLKIYVKELGDCVKFTEQKTEKSVNVLVGYSCSANVGYNPFKPMVITLPDPCINRRNVKHEFTHLLGFMHEHSRPDRNKHLNVVFENVETRLCPNFHRCADCEITTPYDFDSIMQYSSSSFSCNGKDTMLKKNADDPKIAYNMEVSPLDKKKVRDYYGCNSS